MAMCRGLVWAVLAAVCGLAPAVRAPAADPPNESGDDLVPAGRDGHHLLPARGLVHRRIGARPELLAPYRARIEPRAKRLLDQGEAGRDPLVLAQVVDQFFCSRSAETALNLLG